MNVLQSNNGQMDLASMLARWSAGAGGGGVAAPIMDAGQLASPSIPTLGALTQNAQPSFMDSFLGSRAADGTQTAGWGGMAIGAANGLMNGFLGLQQLGIAKDSLAQGKKQFQMNYDTQKKLTNGRLEDRQAARVAANPAAYQSVGDYMKKNGI